MTGSGAAVLFQNSFLRFLFAGALNTIGTLVLYIVLLEALPPSLAWAIAFAAGIVFINFVYPRFVFRVRGTVLGTAGNTVYYLISFMVSETLLSAAVHWLEFDPRVSGVLVAAMMVPVNFLVTQYVCTRPTRSSTQTTRNSKEP